MSRTLPFLLLLVLAVACGGEPPVKEWTDRGWQALPLELDAVEGTRDGARTRASFRFAGAGGARLELDLMVVVDPQPALDGGTWSWNGPTGTGEGTVRPESLRFAGGQGEGPSIGGVFVLMEGTVRRFRVEIPPTAVENRFTP